MELVSRDAGWCPPKMTSGVRLTRMGVSAATLAARKLGVFSLKTADRWKMPGEPKFRGETRSAAGVAVTSRASHRKLRACY